MEPNRKWIYPVTINDKANKEIQKLYVRQKGLTKLFFALKFKSKVVDKEGQLPTEAMGREGAGLVQNLISFGLILTVGVI